ncbi:MAG: periplasmic heavy metal sensor [Bauldia sp.]
MTLRGPFAITVLAVLFVSLALNLLIAGFVAARIAGPRAGDEIERIVAMGIHAFPPEIRRTITDKALGERHQLRERFEELKRARDRMFEAMRSEPLDRAVLEAAFNDMREKTNALQQAGQDLVAGALADAPPDVRRHIKPPHGLFP